MENGVDIPITLVELNLKGKNKIVSKNLIKVHVTTGRPSKESSTRKRS